MPTDTFIFDDEKGWGDDEVRGREESGGKGGGGSVCVRVCVCVC